MEQASSQAKSRNPRAYPYWRLPVPIEERRIWRDRAKAYGMSGAQLFVLVGRTWLSNPTPIEVLRVPER